MRKSRQGLQPSLNQKLESKLLISSKHTSTISTNLLAKLDHFRHEEHLQREYNLKFMTDRKRSSHQKSQKSLSSSKITHKQPKIKAHPSINLQPQRLDFDSMDYRTKYYQLHDQYIAERRKNMEKSQHALALREALGTFLINFDSRSGEQICTLMEGDKLRQTVKKAIEGRRRAEAAEGVLKEAMRILQVDSWEELVHNLRARIQRFRSLDECTFKILELEAINKRVVNDFEQRLQEIRDDQEEGWERERILVADQLKGVQREKQNCQRQYGALISQHQCLISDISKLTSEQSNPHLISGYNEVNQLKRLITSLRNRLQDIEVQAQQNMFKLLKSNEEMVKLQRSIEQLRGQMQTQIEELEEINQQNLCEINNLHAQLQQNEYEIAQCHEEATKKDAERIRMARQQEDERALLASALGITDNHPAKLQLAIKECQSRLNTLQKQSQQLKAAIQDKDKLAMEQQAQISKLTRSTQEAQEVSKTALYEKEEYKFLLNNLRDQFSQLKKHHQEELARTIQRKDQEIVASNRDILESHATLNDQLIAIRAEHTKLTLQHQQARTSLAHFRNKAEQAERLLIQKEGVIKKLTTEGDRYKRQLREIQGSFREVVDLEEVTSKKALALQLEKAENTKLIATYSHRNAQLCKANEDLSREKNQFKTQLSVALNDIKELKDVRTKLQATNVELRLQGLNKQSDITKLEERLKTAESENRVLKAGNEKLMSEVNAITRKLISARNELKKKLNLKLKQVMSTIREIKAQNNTLKAQVKLELSLAISVMGKALASCLQQVKMTNKNDIQVEKVDEESQCMVEAIDEESQSEAKIVQSECQCTIISSNLRECLFNRLTSILTAISLLRSQQHDIQEAAESLQTFNIEEIFRVIFEDPNAARLRTLQGSIEMIRQDSLEEQESQMRDMAKIITPDEIFPVADEVNLVLMALLEEDQIPSVPYWEKIQANFLVLRRRLTRRSNLKLDISAIQPRDPSLNSPHSSAHQNDLFRRLATDPDDPFDHRDTITNRSQRFNGLQATKKENDQLKLRLQEVLTRLGDSHDELQMLRGKLVKLQNETSIVGLEHNFKKVLDYLLNENADLFLQTCRILMKMLHFTDLQIKDFEQKFSNKRKKKKSGLFSGLFG